MTVSAQVIEVLNDLCMKFGLAIDWSQENVLPYLEELAGKYITWEIATSEMWIVIGALLVVSGLIVFATDLKWGWADGFMAIVGFFAIIGGVCVIGAQVYDILTCKHFPEKQLWEYVSGLMRQSRR